MCDLPRQQLMLYFDGELEGQTRQEVDHHIAHCPRCQKEIRQLEALDHIIHDARDQQSLTPPEEQEYYSCVCRKLASRKSAWPAIYTTSIALALSASLMLFALPPYWIYQAMGLLGLALAVAVIWLAEYCRCRA